MQDLIHQLTIKTIKKNWRMYEERKDLLEIAIVTNLILKTRKYKKKLKRLTIAVLAVKCNEMKESSDWIA